MGLNAGFAQVCPYQSLLRTVRSESCCFGHIPVQDRPKGKPQNSLRVAPEVQQYTGITISGICPFFGAAQACFYLAVCIRWTGLKTGLGTGLRTGLGTGLTESCTHHFEASKHY